MLRRIGNELLVFLIPDFFDGYGCQLNWEVVIVPADSGNWILIKEG